MHVTCHRGTHDQTSGAGVQAEQSFSMSMQDALQTL